MRATGCWCLQAPRAGNSARRTTPRRTASSRAFMEGLSGKADFNKDGIVTFDELSLYVAERVKELTKNTQHPVRDVVTSTRTSPSPPSINSDWIESADRTRCDQRNMDAIRSAIGYDGEVLRMVRAGGKPVTWIFLAMARLVSYLLLLSLFTPLNAAAQQPARLALLIGNQNYASAVGTLKNPRQDVALIETSLEKLGFRVTVLNDADYRAMDVALKRYAAELRRAGQGALGFFYYSGHGAANADTQTNYLIPVDVTSAEDEAVWYYSFPQNQIIDLLSKQGANATQFVVFDACRNELHLSDSAAKAIGADKGFVPVADTAGLLIAYATAPNRTASDAGEGGGPYAKALAEELLKPGVEAVTMFRNVQIRVKQAIGQDPWLSFPSLAPVYLAGRDAGSGQEIKPQPQPSLSEAARGAWSEIKDLKDVAVFEAFRKQYGAANALYDTLATQKIAELKRQQVAIAPARKPDFSEDECDGLRVSVALSNEKPCIKPGFGESFKDCPDCPEMVIAPVRVAL